MKTTTVVAVYNGSHYIEEQLNSLIWQTQTIDEVIIIDDFSQDNTCELIERIIAKSNLFQWKLIRNKQNIGWKRSFKKGLDLSSGDLVFLCDQDDIWYENKVMEMSTVIRNNPDIMLLASNYDLLFDEGYTEQSPYVKIAKEMKNDKTIKKLEMNRRWFYVKRPGCTYCIRKFFLDSILPFWDDTLAHDQILWSFSYISNGLYIFNTPTMQFRRHITNVSGHQLYDSKSRISLLEENTRMISLIECFHTKDNNKYISEAKYFFTMRLRLYNEKKLSLWFLLFFRYRKFYLTLKGLAYDLFICIKK